MYSCRQQVWVMKACSCYCSTQTANKQVQTSSAKETTATKSILSQFIYCDSRTRANHFLPFAVAPIVTQYATNVSNTCLVAFAYFQGEFFQHKNIGCVIKSICLCGFTINQISQLLQYDPTFNAHYCTFYQAFFEPPKQ